MSYSKNNLWSLNVASSVNNISTQEEIIKYLGKNENTQKIKNIMKYQISREATLQYYY